MKRIIDGRTYNTDTAARVTVGEHPHSFAGWELYQNRHGAFFVIVTDHDGETQTIKPLSDAEAQNWLEKYANHLVETYFGTFPEVGAAERRLTIRIPENLASRMEIAAKGRQLSLNSYAMRCFEQCAQADGQQPVQT